MTFESALDNEAHAVLEDVGKADIVVGIPSFNNAGTIGHVAGAAIKGITQYFPDSTAVLMNSDGGSSDATFDSFLDVPCPDRIRKLATCYRGMPGKGSALKAVFEACAELDARACVLVDSDLRSITPEWIKLLAGPIVEDGAEYVTPFYLRHKYDGTITNSLAYPVTRALYGKRVRQPIGGDFGVSGRLARSYLEKDVWHGTAAQFGIDIFMTTTAINEGFDIRQANLGAKIHDTKDPAADLGPMFRQVVGTMFMLMKKYESKWAKVKGSRPVPTVGPSFQQDPEPVGVTLDALVHKFKEGMQAGESLWREFLPEAEMRHIADLAGLDGDSFVFPPRLWVRIVYAFATAYNAGSISPEEVVDSLTPLYFGRTAGFVNQTAGMNSADAEDVLETLAETFEEEKPYLVEIWNRK